jgi:hypothetical protein
MKLSDLFGSFIFYCYLCSVIRNKQVKHLKHQDYEKSSYHQRFSFNVGNRIDIYHLLL